MHTLYLCYFGLREPLVQTQVLPYLRELSKDGIEVTLLTFEPRNSVTRSADDAEAATAELEAAGIRWYSRRYHKRPRVLSTFYDIVAGARQAIAIARRHRVDVLHARAHVPMAIALMIRYWTGCRLVFDIRGLMAEEYADAGTWRDGSVIFRLVKRLERAGLNRADQIVVLTRRMKSWLIEQERVDSKKVEVIPCCVDFERFNGYGTRRAQGTNDRFELVYAGAAAGLYLVDEMAEFFLALRTIRQDAFFRIMTMTPPDQVTDRLMRRGLDPSDFWVGPVPVEQVTDYLTSAQLGISFRKPTFSQIAASPTKIPEYLAAGIPVVCNAGVGDTDRLVEGESVGIVIRSFNRRAFEEASIAAAAIAAQPDIASRCIRVARREFDLVRVGAAGYRRVYRRIGNPIEPASAELSATR